MKYIIPEITVKFPETKRELYTMYGAIIGLMLASFAGGFLLAYKPKRIGGYIMAILKFLLLLIGSFVTIVAAGWVVIHLWWVFALIAAIWVANTLS